MTADWSWDVNIPTCFPEGKRMPSLTVSEIGVLASHEMVRRATRRAATVVMFLFFLSSFTLFLF
jgi:hypothetical protein